MGIMVLRHYGVLGVPVAIGATRQTNENELKNMRAKFIEIIL